MEIRVLVEDELIHASGLSRYVFDTCLRNRMEFTQSIPFVENYISETNLKEMHRENKLVVWGAFEQGQLVGVGGLQTGGMMTLLYVLPQYTGKNCGARLLTTMRAYAKDVLKLSKVVVNATPAWTSAYFQKHGFMSINQNPNLRVPFLPMQALSEKIFLQKRERISAITVVWAIAACVGFATIVGTWFMISYLFM
jgi:N-acetylglutamate synthase-like GNAT family acetyltransferase